MANEIWNDDGYQFPRLLAELRALGLTPEQYAELQKSMDLDVGEIDELLERAEREWQAIKWGVLGPPGIGPGDRALFKFQIAGALTVPFTVTVEALDEHDARAVVAENTSPEDLKEYDLDTDRATVNVTSCTPITE